MTTTADLRVQIEVADPPGLDSLIPGGIDHGDHVEWTAVAPPEPVEGFTGTPAEIAEAVASDYAETLTQEAREQGTVGGSRVRATVLRPTVGPFGDPTGEELATSGVYVADSFA